MNILFCSFFQDKNISGIAREIQGNGEKFKADYGISSGITNLQLQEETSCSVIGILACSHCNDS